MISTAQWFEWTFLGIEMGFKALASIAYNAILIALEVIKQNPWTILLVAIPIVVNATKRKFKHW